MHLGLVNIHISLHGRHARKSHFMIRQLRAMSSQLSPYTTARNANGMVMAEAHLNALLQVRTWGSMQR